MTKMKNILSFRQFGKIAPLSTYCVGINILMAFSRFSAKRLLWLPLSILLFLSTISASAQCGCTDCRCSDSLSLVDLYNATNGANWTTKWVLTQPMTAWYGVTLTNGRVTCIDLDGTVNCANHYSFAIGGNNLVGTIPSSLESLNNLRFLSLSQNQLSGSIPNFNLPNLQYMGLSSNQLSGNIPNFDLPNLQFLYLVFNQLSGSIPNFNLPNLQELVLHSNQLSGGIPNFNLPNLNWLGLYSNQLSGSIPNFNLPNLVYLRLEYNKLSGSVPNFNLPYLSLLDISDNQLSGSIPNFNLPYLRDMRLYSNQLSGSIPNFILPNLQYLYLSSNQLSGSIPNFILPNLKSLDLSQNQLSGGIPNFNLPNLQYLYLPINQLSGGIPNFILPNLQTLHLTYNQLSGSIPNFNMPNLQFLFLYSNQLSGCIPQGIKIKCPRIGANGGSISNNSNLATQSWANYWNNGEGACAATAVSDLPDTAIKLAIYPNPTQGDVNMKIRILEAGTYNVQVLDALGKNVVNQNAYLNNGDNSLTVSIAQLAKGLYLAKVSKGDQAVTQKLIVQ